MMGWTAAVTASAALAALMVGLFAWLRADISSVRKDVSGLRDEIGKLRERMAHLEGLLEGLREAITGRQAA